MSGHCHSFVRKMSIPPSSASSGRRIVVVIRRLHSLPPGGVAGERSWCNSDFALTRRPHEKVRLDRLALLQLSAGAAETTLAHGAGIPASAAILRIARKTCAAHAASHARFITWCTGAEPSPTCFRKRAAITTSPAVVCIVNKCDRIDASSLAPFLGARAGHGANPRSGRRGLGRTIPHAASRYHKGHKQQIR